MDATALPTWLDAMFPPGHTRRLVDVGGARMHFWEWGSGLPVVLVHGNPSWSFLWRKVVAQVLSQGQRIRVIVPDLIGLGLSDKPRDPAAHTLAAHARWLGALLDQVAPTELVLGVQDWGGPIGLGALAERPERLDRLRGLVVLNTVLGPPREGSTPTAFHRFARLPLLAQAAFRLGFPQNLMALSQGNKLSIVGKVARAYRWPLRHVSDRVAPLALARMVPDTLDHPSVAGLRAAARVAEEFRGPSAIVWGERDPILGRALARTQALLPRATVTRTSAGHFLQEEVPEVIAAAICDVIARATAN
ncbi:MAG: alpha/beta fold hydrolase [Deltaproteobacteria bacterium]|nr:alpha/beta fold hydrolase [Deltaproteobacteria bacterium]